MIQVHNGPLGGYVYCHYCHKPLTLQSKTHYRHCVECNGEYDDNLKPINIMQFIFPEKRTTRWRLFLLKQGFIKPKSLQESREAFPFPLQIIPQPKKKFWAIHVERIHQHGSAKGSI